MGWPYVIDHCKKRWEARATVYDKGKGKGYADDAGKGFADESSKGTVYGKSRGSDTNTGKDDDLDAALRRALRATKGFGPKDWEAMITEYPFLGDLGTKRYHHPLPELGRGKGKDTGKW